MLTFGLNIAPRLWIIVECSDPKRLMIMIMMAILQDWADLGEQPTVRSDGVASVGSATN